MRRGTTPTLTITVPTDLTGLEIHLALDAGALIEKHTDDLDITYSENETTVKATLTQEDTLAMQAGTNCEIQIRAYTADGAEAMATSIAKVPVERILKDGKLGGMQSA